ncbi:MAG: dephospho-CoA kinase [Pseudomonadota bacterium]
MIIIGLTGSIAMGKSTAAAMLSRLGLPVFDADRTVHILTGPRGAALPQLKALFPGAVSDQGLNRMAVGADVFKHPEKKRQLEAVLHPMVRAQQRAFLQRHRRYRTAKVVLDVPLLFETGGKRRCDTIFVVSAPAFLQRQRALSRPGMTPEKLDNILASQMPDAEKRRRADAVIPTGLGKAVTLRALKRALRRRRGLRP